MKSVSRAALPLAFCLLSVFSASTASNPPGNAAFKLALGESDSGADSSVAGRPPLQASPCDKVRTDLAEHVQRLTYCFVYFSRPFRICRFCQQNIRNFTNFYSYVQKSACSHILFDWSLLNKASNIYTSLTSVWSLANCQQCFSSSSSSSFSSSSSSSASPSAAATSSATSEALQHSIYGAKFTKLIQSLNETFQCLSRYTNADLSNIFDRDYMFDFRGKTFNTTLACHECQQVYANTNDLYNELIPEDSKNTDGSYKYFRGMCGDVAEMLNSTRYIWSEKFRCRAAPLDWNTGTLPLLVSLVLVVLFYGVSNSCWHRNVIVRVHPQKRLARRLFSRNSSMAASTRADRAAAGRREGGGAAENGGWTPDEIDSNIDSSIASSRTGISCDVADNSASRKQSIRERTLNSLKRMSTNFSSKSTNQMHEMATIKHSTLTPKSHSSF